MPEADSKSVPLEVSQMTKLQKLAALLIIVGPDAAGQIMKNLGETELEAVATEMTKIPMIAYETQADLLREFSNVAYEASSSILGGVDYAQAALEKSVGAYRASSILGRVSAGRAPVAAMQTLADMEPRAVYNLIKNEQPQTIALVMSYLGPQKSAQLLVHLPQESRQQVVERIATLAPTPIEVVEKVVEVLNHKAGVQHSRGLNQTGGLKTAADLLNALQKDLSKTLLISIEEANNELGTGIRSKMFIFEDLRQMTRRAFRKSFARSTCATWPWPSSPPARNSRPPCSAASPSAPPKPSTRKWASWARSRPRTSSRRRCASSRSSAASKARARLNWAGTKPMKARETIRLAAPCREVKIARSGERETLRLEDLQASYERGRIDGERALSEQLVRQRAEVMELQTGVLRSLSSTGPSDDPRDRLA